MIVRETNESFTMISQNDQGHAAERIMRHWKKDVFPEVGLRQSVLFAVQQHDVGWVPFDEHPFWNDAEQKPYSFIDFPIPSKVILYRRGIDEVELKDPYAAMLCSRHYGSFLASDSSEDARRFVQEEEYRRARLANEIAGFDNRLFEKHYGLLQLGDNFSLYCCVNEPGAAKEKEHPFFKSGIPVPNVPEGLNTKKLDIRFKNDSVISVDPFPFENPFELIIPQRNVLKNTIAENGLAAAYQTARIEESALRFECR